MAAQNASKGLDADRSKIYFDLIISSLGEAARQALNNMDARKYEYQSDFARQYIALGKAEGEIDGRAALIIQLLTLRFGLVDSQTKVRIRKSSVSDLEAIGARVLAAPTLLDALGTG